MHPPHWFVFLSRGWLTVVLAVAAAAPAAAQAPKPA